MHQPSKVSARHSRAPAEDCGFDPRQGHKDLRRLGIMERVTELVLANIDNIDTRRALGIGPRKLSVDRYIDIPLEWDDIRYLADSNSIIRYRNNGYISTHIFVTDVKKLTETVYTTTVGTSSSVYVYNYMTCKDDFSFYPGVLEGVLFSVSPP